MPKNFRITSTGDGSREIQDFNMSYKSNNRQHNFKKRGGGSQYVRPNTIKRLMDEDDIMDGTANVRTNNKFRPNNSRHNKQMKNIPESDWFVVSMKFDKDVDEKVVFEAIRSNITIPFRHYSVRSFKRSISFITNNVTAKILRDLSGRITLPEGQKLLFRVQSSTNGPRTPVTSEVIAHIEKVMSKRFDIAMNHLDLSNFCNDPDLHNNDLFLNFKNKKVVDAVLNIIGEKIPELKTINMSHNNLESLYFFSSLPTKASKITSIDLTENNFQDKKDLDPFKKLKLEEVSLKGNRFLGKFNNEQDLIKAMRKLFPKLLKLDNNTLPPPINFNTTNTELPASQGSYFGQENVQEIVCRFLRDYLEVYDTGNRSHLINAYHEKASYSLSCSDFHKWMSSSREGATGMGIGAYLSANRNLQIKQSDDSVKRLKTDRNEIMNFLQSLPQTTHDLNTLIVDVSHITPLMIVFNVKGIFQEVPSSSSSSSRSNQTILRQFNRTIVAVPFNNGLAIINEMVNISNLPSANYVKYVEALKAKKAEEVAPQSTTTTLPTPPQGITPQQTEMVTLFSQQSGMNAQFSALCLAENEWNYEMAAAKFTELQRVNAIPPEAFVK